MNKRARDNCTSFVQLSLLLTLNREYTVKKEVTKSGLSRKYGPHAVAVLSEEYLREMPRLRKKGSQRKYQLLKALPTPAEFIQLRNRRFTSTLESLVEEAFEEFSELQQEMTNWYDNLPVHFQDGEKGTQLLDAAEKLEEVEQPQIPSGLEEMPVFYLPPEKLESRSDRLSNAVEKLRAVMELCQEKVAEANTDTDEDEEEKESEYDSSDMEELSADLEVAIGQVEDVEFPTMYG